MGNKQSVSLLISSVELMLGISVVVKTSVNVFLELLLFAYNRSIFIVLLFNLYMFRVVMLCLLCCIEW